jgi:hypothetical protein
VSSEDPFRPITWQDIRLAAGEGRLSLNDTLAAANAELRRRGGLVAERPTVQVADAIERERIKALEAERIQRLIAMPVHVDAEGVRTVRVGSDDFDWLLQKLAICPIDDFEQNDIAKLIRREMQDNSIPARARSLRAAALIMANLAAHPDDEDAAQRPAVEVDRDKLIRAIAEAYSENMAKRFPARMGVSGAPLEHLDKDSIDQAEIIANDVLRLFREVGR